jgi:hypothetical protein
LEFVKRGNARSVLFKLYYLLAEPPDDPVNSALLSVRSFRDKFVHSIAPTVSPARTGRRPRSRIGLQIDEWSSPRQLSALEFAGDG